MMKWVCEKPGGEIGCYLAGVFIADRSYYLWDLFDASWDCQLGGAAFKMEIACLGLQVATTVVYATEASPQTFFDITI